MTTKTTVTKNALPGLIGTLSTMSGTQKATPVSDWFKATLAMYSAETRRRFVQNSRGGGEWPPLAASTVAGRARAGKTKGLTPAGKKAPGLSVALKRTKGGAKKPVKVGRVYAILTDTGMLRNSLDIGAPGNSVQNVKGGVTYGFSSAPHARRGGGRAVTIGDLMFWHHTGAGNNPRRPILHKPSKQLEARLRDAGVRMIFKAVGREGVE